MMTEGFGKPDEYPTIEIIEAHIQNLLAPLAKKPEVLVAFLYQSKKTGQWSPVPDGCENDLAWRADWRKPAPGMLVHAMNLFQANPFSTLMVGDSEDDRLAADAAGCAFEWAWQFFGRPDPSKEPS